MNFSAFAFTRRNISCTTLYSLKSNLIDHKYLLWGESSINKYLELIIKNQPKYILGLGIYTGNNDGKIRIETKCSSRFKNLNQYASIDELDIHSYLKPNQNSKFTTSIGHSFCNLVSYKICKLIESGQIKSAYTFLHIPRGLKSIDTAATVDDMLSKIEG